jgi:hypothetical protein
MSPEENKRTVRRIYDELWNERKLEVAHELIADGGVNYDTGLTAHTFGPEEMKGTVRMVTCAFPNNHHAVEEVIAEGDTVGWRAAPSPAPTRASSWASRPRAGG